MKILIWIVAIVMAVIGIVVSFLYEMPKLFVFSAFSASACLLLASNLLGRREEAGPKKVEIRVVKPDQEPPV